MIKTFACALSALAIMVLPTAAGAAEGACTVAPVTPYMALPFVLLLLAIALMPFINASWWGKNYPWVALALGAVSVCYYLFFLRNGCRIADTATEYISFIALIGSLFVVSGGIHIRIKGRSTPVANVMLLAIGAALSNLLGTTGASMILIRPFIRMNKYRISGYHIVFFIFAVSNIGGLLTPIGDPPLFLGYLKGIPFFWVIGKVWVIWLFALALVLSVFYLMDRHYYKKVASELEREIEAQGEKALVEGIHNVIFLAIIIGAVFLKEPLREIIMIGAATASYFSTDRSIHDGNDFNFLPIKEVAILFAGIFATMVPALDWLELNAGMLGITAPAQFYWGSGMLSSFLDNAPTYLNFLTAAFGLHGLSIDDPMHMRAMLGTLPPGEISHLHFISTNVTKPIAADSWRYIQAISVGSVLFGAMTYIGNGPNFMVKAIAEHSQVKMPTFLGYMVKYSLPVLVPVYALIWYLFFR
ncbi:MAG: sodium:proton antiporter [Smithellaceae bacterium]|nr:sodium:proton antiporter [Smithellaceae bacterium]